MTQTPKKGEGQVICHVTCDAYLRLSCDENFEMSVKGEVRVSGQPLQEPVQPPLSLVEKLVTPLVKIAS